MRLRDYPRPPEDTGIGLHWGSGQCSEQQVRDFMPTLKAMGVKWVKLLGFGQQDDINACRVLIENGIEPIVRLYAERPHPHYVPSRDLIARYVAVGVHYFEGGNEPNLADEWDMNEWNAGDQIAKCANQWMDFRVECLAAGGYPLTYALAPAADGPTSISHERFFAEIMRYIQAKLGGQTMADYFDHCAIGSHPRPFNHPIDYVEDTFAWRGYEWFSDHMRRTYVVQIPQLATEHGYEPGWAQDNRYPLITRDLHASYNMALVKTINNGEVYDALFSGCFWLLGGSSLGNSTFQAAAWLDSNYAEGGELPILAALKAYPKKIRPFRWNQLSEPPGLVLGDGFRRAQAQGVITFKENEAYHWQGTPFETSLAVGTEAKGDRATWSIADNETIFKDDDGNIWRDWGNNGRGDGAFYKVSKSSDAPKKG